MTIAMAGGLPFRIGARTLFSISRRLVRVPLSLDDALSARVLALPPLPPGADGWSVTSLPEHVDPAALVPGGAISLVRQRYTRFHADLTGGFDAWWDRLSANTRSQMKRKAKRVAAANGGTLSIERFATADELAAFHPVARAISATTYQERLLDCGLPGDRRFLDDMAARGRAGTARAWLLRIGGRPAAYLYCPVNGGTVIYEYVGHDPAFADLSPGAVLHVEAMRDLLGEGRFARFDFTEGEGQHKRQLSTGGVACVDLLLLRPTLANRATVAAVRMFDGAVALAKRHAGARWIEPLARRARRG